MKPHEVLDDLDPPMRAFFVVVCCAVIYLFAKIGLDLVQDPWFNGLLTGGLVMFVACGLALWCVVTMLSRPRRR